jgi:Na+-transporting NADH:ubiquinone oxidoreductase subunit C
MDKNSNTYTFIYSSVLVVLVAVLLTLAAIVLKPYQDKNVKVEKMQNILASIGITSNSKNAEELYQKNIISEMIVNESGELLSLYENGKQVKGQGRAFELDLKVELAKLEKKKGGEFPIFLAKIDGKNYYIIPLLGKGLWSSVWGNIALQDDWNTVYGANFDHKSETPGLGAEIADKPKPGKKVFADQFKGKKIFDSNMEFKSITVIKGGVQSQSIIALENGVDAISGGTLTSNGVSDMIKNCLKNYVNFIKKQKVSNEQGN